MTDGPDERVLSGIAVTSGVVLGTIFWRGTQHRARTAGAPQEERQALQRAIDNAVGELEQLSKEQDQLAADILEFQLALLEDDDILKPVHERIDSGASADDAWREIIDREIAEYASAADQYMAARSSDLADLRERVLMALTGSHPHRDELPRSAILLADDLAPSAFLSLDFERVGGLALFQGNPTSHVALLARARGVPMVVGLGPKPDNLAASIMAALDADAGTLTLAPTAAALAAFEQRIETASADERLASLAAHQPAKTVGGRPIRVLVNIDDPGLVEALDPEICDGVGLTRTEFLFSGNRLPDEEAQYRFYARLIGWAAGRPVTIRTLDAGGDKPIPSVTIDGESNPFLGVRGLRLSLRRPELFREQLRALARAAALGPLKIMVPMVTNGAELREAHQHLDAVLDDLKERDIEHARPKLGIMVETPAAALACGDWGADFLSIGSNDLIQYVTASARDNPNVADLADPRHPAVLELIGRTIETGRKKGIEVSLCGDMASSPALVPLLLDLGLEVFSVAPAQIGRVKNVIAESP